MTEWGTLLFDENIVADVTDLTIVQGKMRLATTIMGPLVLQAGDHLLTWFGPDGHLVVKHYHHMNLPLLMTEADMLSIVFDIWALDQSTIEYKAAVETMVNRLHPPPGPG